MKYVYIPMIITLTLIVQTSCGSMNKAHGELHYNNNVTKGQELIDLKNALNKGHRFYLNYFSFLDNSNKASAKLS